MEEETFKTKKLEAIGILAGGIAHDFNNLLSVIIGNIALVRKDMPRSDIEKIFDPYFSTKESKIAQKGKGLGLTICYSIIKKHDGHIVFESRKGKGTTVTLYLPAFTPKI